MKASNSPVGKSKANGRPLSKLDHSYYNSNFGVLNSIFIFKSSSFGNNKQKLEAAFERTIRASPLLQTKVVGESPKLRFQQLTYEEWPKAKFYRVAGGDEAALTTTRSLNQAAIAEIHNKRRVSFSFIRGDAIILLALVAPHYFMDGAAIGAFVKMCIAYYLAPRLCWKLIDQRSLGDGSAPAYMEMILKDQYHLAKQNVDGRLSARMDPSNFAFPGFTPDMAPLCFRGLPYQLVGYTTSPKVLKASRSQLRQSGVSISTAFGALAVKLLASLIHGGYENIGNLVATIGVDGRLVGQWGDKRDKTRSKQFPVIGNYAFTCHSQFSFEDAYESSIEEMALELKSTVRKVQSDVNFRLHEIEANSRQAPKPFIYCGVSSLMIPMQGPLANVVPKVEILASAPCMPMVWFYVLTEPGSQTSIHVQVQLPLPDLTAEIVCDTLSKLVQGTSLEPLFNQL